MREEEHHSKKNIFTYASMLEIPNSLVPTLQLFHHLEHAQPLGMFQVMRER